MPLRSLLVLTACGSLATGCSEWPRLANLPTEELEPGGTDPRELFDLDWVSVADEATNDSPVTAPMVTATEASRAFNMDGILSGIGWDSEGDQVVIDNPGCTTDTGTRSPLPTGEYTNDVDFLVVEVGNAATLCARLAVDDSAVEGSQPFGWDLLLFELSDCKIPGEPVKFDAETVLGLTGGGDVGGWGTQVTQGTYAVMVAGYVPYEPDTDVPYQLGVSLVQNDPDGTAGLCPLLDGESSPAGGSE